MTTFLFMFILHTCKIILILFMLCCCFFVFVFWKLIFWIFTFFLITSVPSFVSTSALFLLIYLFASQLRSYYVYFRQWHGNWNVFQFRSLMFQLVFNNLHCSSSRYFVIASWWLKNKTDFTQMTNNNLARD